MVEDGHGRDKVGLWQKLGEGAAFLEFFNSDGGGLVGFGHQFRRAVLLTFCHGHGHAETCALKHRALVGETESPFQGGNEGVNAVQRVCRDVLR